MAKTKTKELAAGISWPESAFWTFSTGLYGRPGVEAGCLALQERHDLDVNLLLFALWLADCGVVLDALMFKRAKATVASWHAETTGPLRALRRQLRHRIDAADPDDIAGKWPVQVTVFRRKILQLELDCEHLAQLALGHLGDELKPSRRASVKLAGDNLGCLGRFAADDRGDLANLLKQVFPDADLARIDAALDSLFSET
ncbi:MAG: TIGR02444 family protein [Geminicoccaceae bacterium]